MLEISQLLVFHLIYFMIGRKDSPFSQSINQTNGAEIQYIIVCSIVPDVFSLFLVSFCWHPIWRISKLLRIWDKEYLRSSYICNSNTVHILQSLNFPKTVDLYGSRNAMRTNFFWKTKICWSIVFLPRPYKSTPYWTIGDKYALM